MGLPDVSVSDCGFSPFFCGKTKREKAGEIREGLLTVSVIFCSCFIGTRAGLVDLKTRGREGCKVKDFL